MIVFHSLILLMYSASENRDFKLYSEYFHRLVQKDN